MEFLKKLKNDYALRVERYYSQNLTKFYMDLHSHGTAEIMYVLSGNCDIYYADMKVVAEYEGATDVVHLSENQVRMKEMKQGDYILLDQHVPHRLDIDGQQCKILCVEMLPVRLKAGWGDRREPVQGACDELCMVDERLFDCEEISLLEDAEYYIISYDESHVYGALRDIQYEFGVQRENNRIKQMMVDMGMTRLLLEIVRSYSAANSARHQVNTYARKAVNFIRANFDTEFAVQDIANLCGINENYLQRIFKEVQGESIIAYVNGLRMEKAEMLLLNSDMSIVDIAESVGFNSRQHFGHVFQQHNGMSPNAFRKIGGYKGEMPLLEEE